MKGYYVPKTKRRISKYSMVYGCDHPLYNACTLYLDKNGFGLAVIQERYNSKTKMHWWGPIDPWLADDIFECFLFEAHFSSLSDKEDNGRYPTIPVRSLMNLLGMKPLKRMIWETSFSQKIQKV